jgi:hypothetical protein
VRQRDRAVGTQLADDLLEQATDRVAASDVELGGLGGTPMDAVAGPVEGKVIAIELAGADVEVDATSRERTLPVQRLDGGLRLRAPECRGCVWIAGVTPAPASAAAWRWHEKARRKPPSSSATPSQRDHARLAQCPSACPRCAPLSIHGRLARN